MSQWSPETFLKGVISPEFSMLSWTSISSLAKSKPCMFFLLLHHPLSSLSIHSPMWPDFLHMPDYGELLNITYAMTQNLMQSDIKMFLTLVPMTSCIGIWSGSGKSLRELISVIFRCCNSLSTCLFLSRDWHSSWKKAWREGHMTIYSSPYWH